MSKKAAETVVTVIDDDGVGSLISELTKAAVDSEVCFFYDCFSVCILFPIHVLELRLFFMHFIFRR